jgi:prepilin-type N-terminal cleavage/methylation domain-containing protein
MNKKNRQLGFSLIEVLISVSVLLIVLGALSSMAVGIVRTSSTNKYQIEAYNLAQKQLEMAKQLRNTNNIDGDSDTKWNSDQDGNRIVESNKYSYQIQPASGRVELKPGANDINLQNKEYKYYVQFKYYSDDNISDSDYLNIAVNVSWQELGKDRDININSSLTNWYWNYE